MCLGVWVLSWGCFVVVLVFLVLGGWLCFFTLLFGLFWCLLRLLLRACDVGLLLILWVWVVAWCLFGFVGALGLTCGFSGCCASGFGGLGAAFGLV